MTVSKYLAESTSVPKTFVCSHHRKNNASCEVWRTSAVTRGSRIVRCRVPHVSRFLRDVGILTLQLGRNLFRLALSNHLTRIWPRFSVQSAKSCSQDQRSGSLTSTRFGGTGACIAVSRRISSKSTHRDHRTGAARYDFG
jgi:hypothetical protein